MRNRRIIICMVATAMSCAMPVPGPEKRTLEFVKPYLSTLDKTFETVRPMQTVRELTQFYRIAGTPEFDSAVAIVTKGLRNAGFGESGPFLFRVDSYPLDVPLAWRPIAGNLRLPAKSGPSAVIADFERVPLMLCEQSHPFRGSVAVVDVGDGEKEEDYVGRDLRGKVVLGKAPAAVMYHHAVKTRGAIGIISAHVPELNRPDLFPEIVVRDKIPYSTEIRSFGIKISPKQHESLKSHISKGLKKIEILVRTEFVPGEQRVVSATIPGQSHAQQNIVLIAHLDHYSPGANDNASGAATLLEIVHSIKAAIDAGQLNLPARTLHFLWVDEYDNEFRSGGTGAWIRNHMDILKHSVAVFSLDMVGEDTKKTGGTFRLERHPDPAVLWSDRYSGTSSGWGSEPIAAHLVRGTFLNDFTLSTLRSRSAEWKIESNPYEGGSDHVPFIEAGIPGVLVWHFPDYFYHSSMDDADKVDPMEMKNVGVAIGSAAIALASLNGEQAVEIVELLESAARRRLDEEVEVIRKRLASGSNLESELQVLTAWQNWYGEAVKSADNLIDDAIVREATAAAVGKIQSYGEELRHSLKQ